MCPRPAGLEPHGFGSSDPYTLGIEEEFMLLDADSFDLVQRADTILDADNGGEFAARTSCELFQSEIEAKTPVCATVGEAAVELTRLRSHLEAVVCRQGLVLASAGTHPFARYEDQVVTDRPRYQSIVEQVQYPARRELVFGLHVHVGVPGPEAAVKAVGRLRTQIGPLIALSASSPFWRGFASGLHSTRQNVFPAFPRAGVPPIFRDYAEFETLLTALERSGVIDDYTRIWWDLRPSPRLGTVEVRAMDAMERVEDVVAVAAYVQALVKQAVEAPAQPRAGALADELARENKWQAVRHGLDGKVIAPDGSVTPIREQVLRTLDDLQHTAEALSGDAALLGIERIVRAGTGADRQLATYAAAGDLRAVTRSIAERTASTPWRFGKQAAPRRADPDVVEASLVDDMSCRGKGARSCSRRSSGQPTAPSSPTGRSKTC